MAKLVVVENSVIVNMLRNPAIVKEFPFLSAAAKRVQAQKKRSCGSCNKRKQVNVTDYSGIKTSLGNMPPAKLAKLKKLLGAEQVRIYYTNHKRQKVKKTF